MIKGLVKLSRYAYKYRLFPDKSKYGNYLNRSPLKNVPKSFLYAVKTYLGPRIARLFCSRRGVPLV